MANLFIPKKIRVGFQNRSDTFTGKLAYVIYYDEKGKIRKETSWLGWCDSKIPSVEIDNTPRNNYVFNKGIRRYSDWGGSGRSVIRVYDPRDFEFEITVDNLIGLLMHSDVSKRDIVEECVFAWAGPELVLLPVNSEEYIQSVEYTAKQDKTISAKDLVKGHIYSQKKSDTKLTYIGYYKYYQYDNWGWSRQIDKGKRHVFHDGTNFVIPGVATLADTILNEVAPDYAGLVDKFFDSTNCKKLVDMLIEPAIQSDTVNDFFKKTDDKEFLHVSVYNRDNTVHPNFYYYNIDTTNGLIISNTGKRANDYWGYHAGRTSTKEYDDFKKTIEDTGHKDMFKIPRDLFVKTMNDLGYGKFSLINEDGKKIKHKRN